MTDLGRKVCVNGNVKRSMTVRLDWILLRELMAVKVTVEEEREETVVGVKDVRAASSSSWKGRYGCWLW